MVTKLASGFRSLLPEIPWIAQTKLQPPQLRQDLIPRQRLLESLCAAVTSSRLTVIVAPTGYSKTTLLTSMSHALVDLPLAWLSIEAEDNDPALFMHSLIASLRQLNPACGSLTLSIQTTEVNLSTNTHRIAGVLINEIMETLPETFLLVIDDLHWIRHPAIYDALEFLLDRMPPQMHLVIGTRHEPPLTLARLRAQGELAEFRMADMRFTLDEATLLLNEKLRLGLSADDLSTLYNRTEGWPAGLRLFASSLQQTPPYGDRTALISHLAQNNQYVTDLLTEEVFNRENSTIQTFLLQTSILSELTPAQCEAVTGFSNSESILTDLYKRNLFLLELSVGSGQADRSEPSCCYRYHALFADYLQQRLAQTMPDQLPELHRRAGDGEEIPSRAIGHYLAGRWWEPAARLIEQIGEQLLQQGLLDSIQAWILALPAEECESRPQLTYLLGVHALYQHNIPEATSYLQRALRGFESNHQDLEQGRALAHLSAIAFLQADFPRGSRLIKQALKLPVQPNTRVQLLMERARNAQIQGDSAQADADLEAALTIWQTTGNLGLLCILIEGFNLVFTASPGGLDRLEQLCHVASEETTQMDALHQIIVDEQRAIFDLYRGEMGRALETAASALAHGKRLGGRPPLSYWLTETILLTTYVACHHLQDAQQLVDHMLQENQLLQRRDNRSLLPVSRFLYFIAHACWLLDRPDDLHRIHMYLEGMEFPNYSLLTIVMQKMLDGIQSLSNRDYRAASDALREAVSLEESMDIFNIFGSARVLLAQVYLQQDRWDEALVEIEHALAECEQQGAPGRILIEADAAVPLLQLVVEQGQRKALASHLLGILGADQSTSPEPVTISDTGQTLSPREIEVLRLIATGASNQEIADTLVLSLHTVKHHVAHILTKMNVPTRTKAVAKARDLGIIR